MLFISIIYQKDNIKKCSILDYNEDINIVINNSYKCEIPDNYIEFKINQLHEFIKTNKIIQFENNETIYCTKIITTYDNFINKYGIENNTLCIDIENDTHIAKLTHIIPKIYEYINPINFIISTITNDKFTITVEKNSTVEDLIQKIYEIKGIPKDFIRLIKNGQQLDLQKNMRLSEFKFPFNDGDTIHLIIRPIKIS